MNAQHVLYSSVICTLTHACACINIITFHKSLNQLCLFSNALSNYDFDWVILIVQVPCNSQGAHVSLNTTFPDCASQTQLILSCSCGSIFACMHVLGLGAVLEFWLLPIFPRICQAAMDSLDYTLTLTRSSLLHSVSMIQCFTKVWSLVK